MCQQEKIFKDHVRLADNSNVSADYHLHDCNLQFHEDIFSAEAASTCMSLLSVSRVSLHIESAIVGFWANDL